jgi:polyhydroxybutyrate depolymerase
MFVERAARVHAVSDGSQEKVDGRRERTKRTRAAIVGALTELLDEGRIEPTAAEIAERAGVAVRSIGQHFASREDLLLAVAEHHQERLAHEAPDLASPFEERCTLFVAARARLLERSRAMRGAAAVVLARSPAVAKALERVAKERRAETARTFADEIARAVNPEATERTLALVTSGRAWDAMRGELGMSAKAAREQLSTMIRGALLTAALAVVALGCDAARAKGDAAPAPAAPSVAARPYAMHVPVTHDARAPLLVLLHGYGSDHANVEMHLGVDALSEAHGLFVALPDGTPDAHGARFWNASDACCNFQELPVDDVAYIDAILDDAFARYPIDPSRVYVAGFSNGGFMAHRYACDRAERVAAIASFAGDPWKDSSRCTPRVPTSVLQIHGDADRVVPYGGGRPSDGAFRGPEYARAGAFPAARDGIAMWARIDACPDPVRADDAREEVLRYGPCAAGAEVQLWTRHGQPHVLSWSRADGERMWTFLSAHTRSVAPPAH